MTNRARRKADDTSHDMQGHAADESKRNAWVQACAARLIELDAQLTSIDAEQLARSMLEFERTGAMEPVAAAEFVASELGKTHRSALDRRTARRAPPKSAT